MDTDTLKRNASTLIVAAAIVVGIPLLNYAVLPLLGGRVAPPGILMLAVYSGLLTALTAGALVLVYRSARVINFAQLAFGGIGAVLFFELTRRGYLPYVASLPLGLMAGALIGAIFGLLVVTLFFRHPRLVLTVTTIVLAPQLAGLEFGIGNAFLKPEERGRPVTLDPPFSSLRWEISGVPFSVAHVVAVVLTIGAFVALALFLRRTRFGIAIRASAENADRASLLGINVKVVQIAVWAIAGLFSSMVLIFQMAVSGYQPGEGAQPILLLGPMTAAVVAKMVNLPVAMATGFLITVVENLLGWSYQDTTWLQLLLFGVVLLSLLLQKRSDGSRATDSTSWKAIKEIRQTPREFERLGMIRVARRAGYAFLLLVVVAFPWIVETEHVQTGQLVMVYSIVALSLLVLTGWAGQISLGQFALVGIGAWTGAYLTSTLGWSFWLAMPLAAAVTAGFTFIVGLPALRIRGLFLAITTFALAVVLPVLLFGENFLGSAIPDAVERPSMFFIDFDDERSYYYLMLVAFGGVLMMTRALRRSRTGRVLIAIREDEAGARSFGIRVAKTRLSAFALSGAMAGFAGVLLAHQQLGISAAQYSVQQSFTYFIAAVVGGLGTLAGPVLGILFFVGGAFLPNPWGAILIGATPLVVLIFVPGGIAQVVFGMRDGILRVIALRRHIIVPSLFADYSPEAWEKRLAPLSAPLPNRGLAALAPDQRYSLSSRLWGKDDATEKVEV